MKIIKMNNLMKTIQQYKKIMKNLKLIAMKRTNKSNN